MKRNCFLFLVVLFFFFGCAPKNQVILLPDPDGHVGQLEVTSKGGSQVIDKAGWTTGLSSADQKPSDPRKMDQEKIETLFSDALAFEPSPAERFILYFEKGTSNLTEQSRALMVNVLAAVIERESKDISIVGHSDRTGSDEYNQKLSLDRAQSVAGLLQAEGVDPGHMEITSHGEKNPLVPTPDSTDEPRNRRVEVLVR